MDYRIETDITSIYEELFDVNNKTLTNSKITNITNAAQNMAMRYKKLQQENKELRKRLQNMQNNGYDCNTVNNMLICIGALFMVWMTFYLWQEDISRYHKF